MDHDRWIYLFTNNADLYVGFLSQVRLNTILWNVKQIMNFAKILVTAVFLFHSASEEQIDRMLYIDECFN